MSYSLSFEPHSTRPWVIRRADGTLLFTFVSRDRLAAQQTLARLNVRQRIRKEVKPLKVDMKSLAATNPS
jgi:hypothetical protein